MRTSILHDELAVREAVSKAKSQSEALKLLGLRAAGGNFKGLQRACADFEIDLPVFDREAQLRELSKGRSIPLEDILVINSTYTNNQKLLRKLVDAGLLSYECAICGNTGEWKGRKLTLQLDHINGVYNDNRLENLRILCPNCHSQTETWGRR